jgi:hypothetical protein
MYIVFSKLLEYMLYKNLQSSIDEILSIKIKNQLPTRMKIRDAHNM